MTDAALPPSGDRAGVPKTARTISEIVQARVRARYAAETRFRFFGLTMVALAVIACGVLLASILIQSTTAFTENRLTLSVPVTAAKADPGGTRDPVAIRQSGDFQGLVRDALAARFPQAATDGSADDLAELVTGLAVTPLARQVAADPALIGTTVDASFILNDDLDLILKGGLGGMDVRAGQTALTVTRLPDGMFELTGAGAFAADLDWLRRTTPGPDGTAPLESVGLTGATPSILLARDGSVIELTRISAASATARQLVGAPLAAGTLDSGTWRTLRLALPQDGRPVTNALAAYGHLLKAEGAITAHANLTVLTHSDSNEPELAGLAAAIVGSLLTLLVTFFTAVPLGVAAAIYLEEFAPKNRWTDLIEVNINNLAAVPSIVFGLLGFAVFITFFGMPRSAPIVGGVVLTLMSLPVIIIASRAALKAVPPSIREAALGVGASKMQAIFHHVLPLAMPGILTGSILAMAHALGETAPLLMIGMVAFIADVPQGFTDAATVLPVEIYMWASRPERAWDARTALAIMVLLLFMIAMNGLAIWLRRKFERRW